MSSSRDDPTTDAADTALPLSAGRDGWLAGWDKLTSAQQADVAAHIRGLTDEAETYDAPAHGWTCFHCGETFTTLFGAQVHFGREVTGRPRCCQPHWIAKELYRYAATHEESVAGAALMRKAAALIQTFPAGSGSGSEATVAASVEGERSREEQALLARVRELEEALRTIRDTRLGCAGMSFSDANDWFNEQARSALTTEGSDG